MYKDDLSTQNETYKYGTNPNIADTDGDSISNSEEIRKNLDPTRSDTDGDGISDANER
jgi:hypothetical protein